jgi:hypothetical protein
MTHELCENSSPNQIGGIVRWIEHDHSLGVSDVRSCHARFPLHMPRPRKPGPFPRIAPSAITTSALKTGASDVPSPSHHPSSRLESRATLMVCVIVFEADSGIGFMPASEYDGDMDAVVYEFDPFAV